MQETENTVSSAKPLDCGDRIDMLITRSDFYIENLDPSQPPWFSPGDHLYVDPPSDTTAQPTLYLVNRNNTDKLVFNTVNSAYKCDLLSPLALFVTFDVELKEYPGKQWRFELLAQRLPARLCCKPNNQDLDIAFYFYLLDSRFDPSDETCGQTQDTGGDGSGGGLMWR